MPSSKKFIAELLDGLPAPIGCGECACSAKGAAEVRRVRESALTALRIAHHAALQGGYDNVLDRDYVGALLDPPRSDHRREQK